MLPQAGAQLLFGAMRINKKNISDELSIEDQVRSHIKLEQLFKRLQLSCEQQQLVLTEGL